MKSMRTLIENRTMVVVDRDTSVLDAATRMTEHGVGAVPVLSGDRVVGIFTERDIMSRIVAAGRDPASTRMADVMTTNLLTADIEDTHETCMRRMQQAKIRHLLILDAGRFAGIVSVRDLLYAELGEKDEALNLLNAYVSDIPYGTSQG